jgi:hypothetical protein
MAAKPFCHRTKKLNLADIYLLSVSICVYPWLQISGPGDIRVGFIFQSYAKVGIHRRQNVIRRAAENLFTHIHLILRGDHHFLAR